MGNQTGEAHTLPHFSSVTRLWYGGFAAATAYKSHLDDAEATSAAAYEIVPSIVPGSVSTILMLATAIYLVVVLGLDYLRQSKLAAAAAKLSADEKAAVKAAEEAKGPNPMERLSVTERAIFISLAATVSFLGGMPARTRSARPGLSSPLIRHISGSSYVRVHPRVDVCLTYCGRA